MSLGADYERMLRMFRRAGIPLTTDRDATFIQIPGTRFDFDTHGKLTGCVVVLP